MLSHEFYQTTEYGCIFECEQQELLITVNAINQFNCLSSERITSVYLILFAPQKMILIVSAPDFSD
jgi:hypothetical protein